MRFQDIRRQNGKWTKQCQYFVRSVSPPQDSKYGLCQTLEADDSVGLTEVLNYFYNNEQFEIDSTWMGKQWLDVRYKDDYYQCVPVDAPPQTTLEDSGPDWDKIALGKCRHGILCAYIQHNGLPTGMTEIGTDCLDQRLLKLINMLAKFSMTGEINEDS